MIQNIARPFPVFLLTTLLTRPLRESLKISREFVRKTLGY